MNGISQGTDSSAPALDGALHKGYWHLIRTAILAIGIGLVTYLIAFFGRYLSFPPDNIAVFWPPNTVFLTVLLLMAPRRWWICFAVMMPAYFISGLQGGLTIQRQAIFFVANCSEVLVAAIALRHVLSARLTFGNLREALLFVAFAVLAGPFVSACVSSLDALLFTDVAYLHAWRVWFMGDALAHLTLTPLLLVWVLPGKKLLRAITFWRCVEAAGLAIGLVAVGFYAFGGEIGASGDIPVLVYTPLPLLLWAAVRFGPRGTFSAVFIITVLSIWDAVHGRGPFDAPSAAENVLSLQLFLVVLSVPTMFLAALIQERRRAGEAMSESEEQYRQLAENTEAILWEYDVLSNRWAYMAPQSERILGYRPEEWTDLQFWIDHVHQDDRDWATKYCAEHTARGESHEFEYRFLKKDGGVIWVRDVVSVALQDDLPVTTRGFMFDVTERRKAEEALRDAEKMNSSLLDGIPDCIAMILKKGTHEIVASNKLAQEIGAVPGQTCFQTCALRDDRCSFCLAPEMWETNQPQRTEAEYRGKWYEGIWVPLSEELYVHYIFDITERKHAEERIRDLAGYPSENPYPVLRIVSDGTILYANPAATRLLENQGRSTDGQAPEDWQKCAALAAESESVVRGEFQYGKETFAFLFAPLADAEYVNVYGIDITEQKHLESQFQQAQKMEAVGQLAGGIAHDFNNLLQAILGYGELALTEDKKGKPTRTSIEEILKAGERAKTLVSQLLAFSRRQVLEMQYVDLNEIIADLMKMIRRVIGEHITLDILPGHDLGTIRADRGQLGQILTNLCVNARDAMPEGGTITIETENIRIDQAYCVAHAWAKPGRYALLSITDTGCGMDEETLDRAFDPFFTTKGSEGTGLGLATVYGLAKQHDGQVEVYSEVDKGTTFKVYLPIVERPATTVGSKVAGPVPGGTETILLAEDDEIVLGVAKAFLESAGYTVLTAADGEEALRVFGEHNDGIGLALLDVMMPKLGGRAVFESIRQTHPQMSVLFASGYSLNAIHTNFVLDEGMTLIQKPYQRANLLRKVREALDSE